MPSFPQLLTAVDDAWRERRGEVVEMAGRMTEALRSAAARTPVRRPARPTELLSTPWRRSSRCTTPLRRLRAARPSSRPPGDRVPAPRAPPQRLRGALAMATDTLDGMALGGMYDVLGGGFHRYSVDGAWLVPHFEKMLYDNALLAVAYLRGGRSPAPPATGRWPRPRSTTWCASWQRRRAGWPPRRMPTRSAWRGRPSCGRPGSWRRCSARPTAPPRLPTTASPRRAASSTAPACCGRPGRPPRASTGWRPGCWRRAWPARNPPATTR